MDLKELYELVMAMADGYSSKLVYGEDENEDLLLVENPKFEPHNGEDPYLVLNLQIFQDFCLSETK